LFFDFGPESLPRIPTHASKREAFALGIHSQVPTIQSKMKCRFREKGHIENMLRNSPGGGRHERVDRLDRLDGETRRELKKGEIAAKTNSDDNNSTSLF
jgi:hypothetical protein